MPRISQFFGIVILMFYDDHSPPHFHIKYAEHKAEMSIATLEVLEGKLPNRVLSLVLEWSALHRSELVDDWERARQGLPLQPIEPLD